MTKNKLSQWDFLTTALWGYSTVVLFLLIPVILLPSRSTLASASDNLGGLLIFAPIFLFLLLVAIRHKQYEWNWWKVLLQIYSLVLLLLALLLAFIPPSGSSSSGDSLVGLIIFLPVFSYLVVRGYERLS